MTAHHLYPGCWYGFARHCMTVGVREPLLLPALFLVLYSRHSCLRVSLISYTSMSHMLYLNSSSLYLINNALLEKIFRKDMDCFYGSSYTTKSYVVLCIGWQIYRDYFHICINLLKMGFKCLFICIEFSVTNCILIQFKEGILASKCCHFFDIYLCIVQYILRFSALFYYSYN